MYLGHRCHTGNRVVFIEVEGTKGSWSYTIRLGSTSDREEVNQKEQESGGKMISTGILEDGSEMGG